MSDGSPAKQIPLAKPSVGQAEYKAIVEAINSGWLTQGPAVKRFEDAFAERHGVRHAIACASGTAALHLALAAVGIGPGDEVIVPAFTWVATANAVLYCGATPVLCDVDPRTYTLCIDDMARRVTARTRAVIPVHLFGLPADMDAVGAAVPEHVVLIEDAACAVGAGLRGRPCGAMGTAGIFSFHPRKVITTGEGGMVTTDDDALAARLRALRNHGAVVDGPPGPGGLADFPYLGFNYRLSDVLALMGESQLHRLDAILATRRRQARRYLDGLADLRGLRLPVDPGDVTQSWQAFVVFVDPDKAPLSRDALMAALRGQGIATQVGTQAVHMLSYYRTRFGYRGEELPGARVCVNQTMALPLYEGLSEDDQDYVIRALRARLFADAAV